MSVQWLYRMYNFLARFWIYCKLCMRFGPGTGCITMYISTVLVQYFMNLKPYIYAPRGNVQSVQFVPSENALRARLRLALVRLKKVLYVISPIQISTSFYLLSTDLCYKPP